MMALKIRGYAKGQDDSFVKGALPNIIRAKLIGCWKDANTQAIDEYIGKQYGISSKDIISSVCDNLRVSWVGDTCNVSIDPNSHMEQVGEKTKSMMKLLEYGNPQIKGLGIFGKSLVYVRDNINLILRVYQRGKEAR